MGEYILVASLHVVYSFRTWVGGQVVPIPNNLLCSYFMSDVQNKHTHTHTHTHLLLSLGFRV
jgi:hypothetical protein